MDTASSYSCRISHEGGISQSSSYQKVLVKWPAKSAKTLCYTMPSYCSIKSKRNHLSKPELLQHLEMFLEYELSILNCPKKGPHVLRLQVFGEVFDKLIVQFTTYQPLMSAIKNEYDLYIRLQNELIQELLPLKNKLYLIQNENERKFNEFKRTTEMQNKRNLAKSSEKFKQAIKQLQFENASLKLQKIKLSEEQLKTTQSLQNEIDAKKIQIREINELKDNVKELEEKVEYSSMIREKTFLETYKAQTNDLNIAQAKVQELLEKIEENKRTHVPYTAYIELQDSNIELNAENKQIKLQYKILSKEHSILQKSFKKLQQEKSELDNLYRAAQNKSLDTSSSSTCSIEQATPLRCKTKFHSIPTIKPNMKEHGYRRAKPRKSVYKIKWPGAAKRSTRSHKKDQKANKMSPQPTIVVDPQPKIKEIEVHHTKSSSLSDLGCYPIKMNKIEQMRKSI